MNQVQIDCTDDEHAAVAAARDLRCVVCPGALELSAAPPFSPVSTPSRSRPLTAVDASQQAQITHCLVSLIEDVQVPAREAGALTAVEVVEGQFVTAGQLLAQIDDRQPKLDKLAAELERDAALAKAQDDIEVRYAEAALAVAAAELERALAIDAKSPGGVTQQEIQKLRLAKHRDELQIERSKLEMRVAKMNADVHQAGVASGRRRGGPAADRLADRRRRRHALSREGRMGRRRRAGAAGHSHRPAAGRRLSQRERVSAPRKSPAGR